MSSIIVVGHKNPDNDAISAAVGYAYLKNELARRAGVEATVDVYPGLFHAFDMLLPFLKVSRRAAAAFEAHFEYALHRSAG